MSGAASIVVLRLLRAAVRLIVSAWGDAGSKGLGFLTRSFIRLSSDAVEVVAAAVVVVVAIAVAAVALSAAVWRSRRRREASALSSSGRQLVVRR